MLNHHHHQDYHCCWCHSLGSPAHCCHSLTTHAFHSLLCLYLTRVQHVCRRQLSPGRPVCCAVVTLLTAITGPSSVGAILATRPDVPGQGCLALTYTRNPGGLSLGDIDIEFICA